MTENRPNILIWAVGHSGTSIITKAFAKLGWNTGEVNGKFENLDFLKVTQDVHYKGEKEAFFERGNEIVKNLPEPWILKSTFIITGGEKWLQALNNDNDFLLLHFERNAEAIYKSHQRRNEGTTLEMVYKKQKLLRESFSTYNGQKISLSFENLMDTIDLFDTDRTRYGRGILLSLIKLAKKINPF